MASFTEERYEINGVDTAVSTAGDGPPLVYFHGAGTLTGFDCLLPLAERFRLVVPHHPGYGASADDPRIDSLHDYVLHYLDLFDELAIDELTLVGFSMGGALAATFAAEQPKRVRRLALVAPFGLRVPDYPTVDLFSIPDEEFLSYLAVDMSVFDGKVPLPPTPEFLAARYRESTSTARIYWDHPYERKLERWLHRLTMPTLLLWGDQDRLIPVQQAAVWAEHIPNATVEIVPGAGHLILEESRQAVDLVVDFAAQELAVG